MLSGNGIYVGTTGGALFFGFGGTDTLLGVRLLPTCVCRAASRLLLFGLGLLETFECLAFLLTCLCGPLLCLLLLRLSCTDITCGTLGCSVAGRARDLR